MDGGGAEAMYVSSNLPPSPRVDFREDAGGLRGGARLSWRPQLCTLLEMIDGQIYPPGDKKKWPIVFHIS